MENGHVSAIRRVLKSDFFKQNKTCSYVLLNILLPDAQVKPYSFKVKDTPIDLQRGELLLNVTKAADDFLMSKNTLLSCLKKLKDGGYVRTQVIKTVGTKITLLNYEEFYGKGIWVEKMNSKSEKRVEKMNSKSTFWVEKMNHMNSTTYSSTRIENNSLSELAKSALTEKEISTGITLDEEDEGSIVL